MKNKEKTFLTNRQKYINVGIFAVVIIIAVIIINISIYGADSNILSAEATGNAATDLSEETTSITALTSGKSKENEFSITTASTVKINTETTTSISVQADGTTVYIQTNVAPVEGRYLSKEDAEKSKPTTAPVMTTTTGTATTSPDVTNAASPIVTTTVTTTATSVQQYDNNGFPRNAADGQLFVDSNGKEWVYDELWDNWLGNGGTAPGITLSPEQQAEVDAMPGEIIGH